MQKRSNGTQRTLPGEDYGWPLAAPMEKQHQPSAQTGK
jgi:hypothetical protein